MTMEEAEIKFKSFFPIKYRKGEIIDNYYYPTDTSFELLRRNVYDRFEIISIEMKPCGKELNVKLKAIRDIYD